MQIHKIMQPKMDPTHLQRRRQLYRESNWPAYEQCMKQELDRGVQVSRNAHHALAAITGLTQHDLHRSTNNYSKDLDMQQTLQNFLSKINQKQQLQTDKELTRQETLEAVKFLQDQQVESYKNSLKQVADKQGPNAQEEI